MRFDFLGAVPQHIVVVLDEAYNEYLPAEQQYDAIAMVRQYPHLLVSRSFSKAYGLAGLRLGYSVAQPELTDLLNRIRQPFNVNTLAQAAAIAALKQLGTTFVIMTHRTSILGVADKMLLMRDGAQQMFGPRDEVLKALQPQPQAQVQQVAAAA